jgi:hypothetical protein
VKAAYDLRALAGDYPEGDNDELRFEALRVLGRKRTNQESAQVVARARKLVAGVRSARDLRVIADELVIGQWLGDAMDQASGMRASKHDQQQEAREDTP